MVLDFILTTGYANTYNIGTFSRNFSLNTWAFQFAGQVASAPLTSMMSTLAGSFLIIIPLLVLYLYFKRDMNAYSLVIIGVLLYVIAEIIKLVMQEPRPCSIQGEISWLANPVSCESGFSFPSAHASVLTGLALFTKGYKYIRVAYIAWLFLVLFGRVYLGAHYFTDVIAGVVLSVVVTYVVSRYSSVINRTANNIIRAIIPRAAITK